MRIFATVLALVLFGAVIAMFILSYFGIQWQSFLTEGAPEQVQVEAPQTAVEPGFRARTGVDGAEASRMTDLSSRQLDGGPPRSRNSSPEAKKGVTVQLKPRLLH